MFGRKQARWAGLPAVRMSTEALERAMAVDEATPLLTGVNELIERVQVEALTVAGDEANGAEERMGAATRYSTLEDLKNAIEDWRKRGVERVRT